MKEHGILLQAPLVRAVLAGQKTETRRPVTPSRVKVWRRRKNHLGTFDWTTEKRPSGMATRIQRAMWTFGPRDGQHALHFGLGGLVAAPRVKAGDALWVRETWAPVEDEDGPIWYDYRATPRFAEPGVSHPAGWENAPDDAEALKWRPSILMPRAACRLVLPVTKVRMERLQDITDADVEAEGVEGGREGFRRLWDEMYRGKPYAWDRNPWVLVYRWEAP